MYRCSLALRQIVTPYCRLSPISISTNVKIDLAFTKLLPAAGVGSHNVMSVRDGSFFTRMTGNQLWDGVTSVSKAGQKKGRAKTAKRRVQLYKGKRFGWTRKGKIQFPGLNSRVIEENKIPAVHTIPHKEDALEELIKLRNDAIRRVRRKYWPLERGWSGGKRHGMSAGKPDPANGYDFEGFDSRILRIKMVSHMSARQGRKGSFWALVAVGNGQGLVGVAKATGTSNQATIRKAKNTAAQQLQYINLKDQRTLWHTFYEQNGATKVFAEPRPEGFGVVCHRALKTLSDLIGIKDMYCKSEGRTKNIINLTDAFIRGLTNMETHQELADKSKYYVVELSHDHKVPTVLAAPSDGEVVDKPIENFDMERHYMQGKTRLRKERPKPFYHTHDAYKKYEHRWYKKRHQDAIAIKRLAGTHY